MDFILTNIGALVVAGGGGAAIAWALMRAFGEKWLEGQFAKQLEAFRHEQQKELEQVRYRINSYFDRAVRLHAIEFEVLPEVWGRLNDAFYSAKQFTSWLQSFPDVDKMKPEQLEAFLDQSPLLEYQKADIRAASQKTDEYIRIIFFHDLNRTQKAFREFNGYLMKKGVLLQPEIVTKFNALGDIIWNAIVEKEIFENSEMRRGKRAGGLPPSEKRDVLEKQGEPLIEELRQIVQNALRDSKSVIPA